MSRYIDLDKFDNWNMPDNDCYEDCNFSCTDCYYNDGGKEDVAPVIHAEWLKIGEDHYKCSNCESEINNCLCFERYCYYCGAEMKRE